MTDQDDALIRRIAELGPDPLPDRVAARTLARAEAWLEPEGPDPGWRVALGRFAVPVLLLSAAAVFAADTCARIWRLFGG